MRSNGETGAGELLKVYGLKNCDTCRTALQWLAHEKIPHSFIDVRADGIAKAEIARFAKSVGWEKLLNKASTSWRALQDSEKEFFGEAGAVALMHKYPTLIKRPVFDTTQGVLSGFRDAEKKALKALK